MVASGIERAYGPRREREPVLDEDDFLVGYRRNVTVTGTLVAAGDSVALPAMQLRRDSNLPPAVTVAVAGFTIHAGYCAASDGSDADAGTKTQPFATIQHGLDAADANGEVPVYIAEGTYTESLVLRQGCWLRGGYIRASWNPSGQSSTVELTQQVPMQANGLTAMVMSGLDERAADATVAAGGWGQGIYIRSGAEYDYGSCTFEQGLPGSGGMGGLRGGTTSRAPSGPAGLIGDVYREP